MNPKSVRRYSTQKLNDFSDEAWAVIEEPRGSIVRTTAGELMMRLSKSQAAAAASRLNAELEVAPSRSVPALWPSQRCLN